MAFKWNNFIIDKYATFKTSFTLKTTIPADKTGYSARMLIRNSFEDPTVLCELSTGNGRLSLTGSDINSVNFGFNIPKAVTGALQNKEKFVVYDVFLTAPSDGEAKKVMYGIIRVRESSTHD